MLDIDDGDEAIPTPVIDSKIAEYEAFVEKVLKGKLRQCMEVYRKDLAVLDQCRELRENIIMLLRDDVTELETMVEIGCQFYAKAFVPDTSRIILDVGLGFRMEMGLEEARDFLELRMESLEQRLELHCKRTSKVKADIHEALHMLDLMMQVRTGGTPWLECPEQSVIDAFTG